MMNEAVDKVKLLRPVSAFLPPPAKRFKAPALQSKAPAPQRPADPAIPREMNARSAEERHHCRLTAHYTPVLRQMNDDLNVECHVAKASEIPWDCRGPVGPADGGPTEWRGQKFREGSQRWGNRGGGQNNRYSLWHKNGRDYWWHPKNPNGVYMGSEQIRRVGDPAVSTAHV